MSVHSFSVRFIHFHKSLGSFKNNDPCWSELPLAPNVCGTREGGQRVQLAPLSPVVPPRPPGISSRPQRPFFLGSFILYRFIHKIFQVHSKIIAGPYKVYLPKTPRSTPQVVRFLHYVRTPKPWITHYDLVIMFTVRSPST